MKMTRNLLLVSILLLFSLGVVANDKTKETDFEAVGWKVGIQSYTFKYFSLFEAIDAAHNLGIKYVEALVRKKIEPGSDEVFDPWNMSEQTRQRIRDYSREKNVKVVSLYYRPRQKDNLEGRTEQLFRFCQEMDLMLTTDPERIPSGVGSMDFYEGLCKKYGVTMMLTNHPRKNNSPYSNPDTVLADCIGRSKYIGASLDVGHFSRDGVNILDAVKKYTDAGRMYHFHFRDVDSNGLDVALGDGTAKIADCLRYMYRKGATPLMLFEYERDMDKPYTYITPSVDFLHREAASIQKEKWLKQPVATKLWAYSALPDDGLRLKPVIPDSSAVFHNWNKAGQCIIWHTALSKGRYTVQLNYAEPHTGSAVTVTAAGQQIAALVPATSDWNEYRDANLGIIDITESGRVTIVLRGVQLALARNPNGKMESREALPDVRCLTFIPTRQKSASQSCEILRTFKGKRLFDGQTFRGWEGNNGEASMKLFRIEDNCIVGGSMQNEIVNNEFVRTTRKYKNFELRLKYRIRHNGSYNGGVQLRSVPQTVVNKEFEMVGYQVDIIAKRLGALYDEQRRNTFLGNQIAVPASYAVEDWNEYIIRCEGRRIRIWLNGIQTQDYIEPDADISQDGYIALQIHEGKPCEAWYKDIEIEELE